MTCDSQVFTNKHPDFFDLDYVIKTGFKAVPKELNGIDEPGKYFSSKIDLTICPCSNLRVEKHDPKAYTGTIKAQSIKNLYTDQFSLDKDGINLGVHSNVIKKADYYYADLVCSSSGGAELRFAYQLNMKATAGSSTIIVNTAPTFEKAIAT